MGKPVPRVRFNYVHLPIYEVEGEKGSQKRIEIEEQELQHLGRPEN
jgi:hypothetical protein